MLCYNVAAHLLFTDPCESSPCKNGGKCISENGEWKCDCTSQYFGLNCEYERNPCQYVKCLNGGTCQRSTVTMNATCICPPFFEGALCDIATDRTFLIVGNRDFIIVIIIAIMTLLSKFSSLIFFFILYLD